VASVQLGKRLRIFGILISKRFVKFSISACTNANIAQIKIENNNIINMYCSNAHVQMRVPAATGMPLSGTSIGVPANSLELTLSGRIKCACIQISANHQVAPPSAFLRARCNGLGEDVTLLSYI
jgi:hypothetical protein